MFTSKYSVLSNGESLYTAKKGFWSSTINVNAPDGTDKVTVSKQGFYPWKKYKFYVGNKDLGKLMQSSSFWYPELRGDLTINDKVVPIVVKFDNYKSNINIKTNKEMAARCTSSFEFMTMLSHRDYTCTIDLPDLLSIPLVTAILASLIDLSIDTTRMRNRDDNYY